MTVTLNGGIGASAIHLLVNAAVADPAPYYQIGSEVLRIESYFENEADGALKLVPNYTRWTVARGQVGTTKATHADGATMTPLYPQVGNPAIDTGGGAAEPGVNIDNFVDPAFLADTFAAPGVYDAGGGVAGWDTVLPTPDEKGALGGGPNAPTVGNYFPTLADLDALPAPALASVLVAGADTGGTEIRHDPAVDVDAQTSLTAAATGTGNANTRPLAQVVDGNAVAGPRAEATGTGNTDACTYARSVDGDALADNDAAATGVGVVDAGSYAVGVDGVTIAAGALATASGSGNATVENIATANTGTATAGSTATSPMGTSGMSAVADGTSARTGFFGTTPIARPELPATPDAQDIADVLVALGLVTQAA